MNVHLKEKKFPTKSAAEVEKWFENLDAMAAARLYGINIAVHEKKTMLCMVLQAGKYVTLLQKIFALFRLKNLRDQVFSSISLTEIIIKLF